MKKSEFLKLLTVMDHKQITQYIADKGKEPKLVRGMIYISQKE